MYTIYYIYLFIYNIYFNINDKDCVDGNIWQQGPYSQNFIFFVTYESP
jgi:hypothetical protein